MKTAAFGFTIPSLPKELYELISRVAAKYALSQRQVIIVALTLLEDVGASDLARVEVVITETKRAYPSRRSTRHVSR